MVLALVRELFILKLLPALLVRVPVKAKALATLLFIVPLLDVVAAPDIVLPNVNDPLLTVKLLDNAVVPLRVKVPLATEILCIFVIVPGKVIGELELYDIVAEVELPVIVPVTLPLPKRLNAYVLAPKVTLPLIFPDPGCVI